VKIPFFTRRRDEKRQADARAGKASSGHLDARERAALFTRHKRGKLPR